MFGYSPLSAITRNLLTLVIIALSSVAVCHSATVYIRPGDEIQHVFEATPAQTTFIIYPGLYHLTQSIFPTDGDRFIGQTAGAPPSTSCPAIISGSTVIGPLATFDGTNY